MDADYPRMMFHREKRPVIVQSEGEEASLGAEWSRVYRAGEVLDPLPDMRFPASAPLEIVDSSAGADGTAGVNAPALGASAPADLRQSGNRPKARNRTM